MLQKLSFILITIIMLVLFSNTIYATEVALNVNNTQNQIINENNIQTELTTDSSIQSTTIADYEDSTELSISNIINIILISVGIVLILLGIAIIIKLK